MLCCDDRTGGAVRHSKCQEHHEQSSCKFFRVLVNFIGVGIIRPNLYLNWCKWGLFVEKLKHLSDVLWQSGIRQVWIWRNNLKANFYLQFLTVLWGEAFGLKLRSGKFCDIKKVWVQCTLVSGLHPCCWRVCYLEGLPLLVFTSLSTGFVKKKIKVE